MEALSAPITSPFGWRTHPVFGTTRFHSGVDLGVDEGTVLTAILPGVVTHADWMGGYGIAVMIDHGNYQQTLFGHCSQALVVEGQRVSAGQAVALSGNTGWSTGPHLHLELRQKGSPVDPMPLLLASGWNISGQYSPSEYYMNSDYDEMLWNFGDFYDVARLLREVLNEFAKHWSQAMTYIQGELTYYLTIFMTIDLVLYLLFQTLKKHGDGFFDVLVRKILQYGLVSALLYNWKTFINDVVLDFVTSIAIKTAGGGDYIAQNMSDPSLIVQKGVFLIQPVFAYLSTFSGVHMVANVHHVFIAMIVGLGIFLCFTLIGIQMLIAYIEFYIICLFAVVTVPTGVFRQTQFMADKGLSGVMNAGLKLMTMTIAVAIVVSYFRDYSSIAYDPIVYFKFLLVSIAIAFFIGRIPAKINSIMNISFRLPDFLRG